MKYVLLFFLILGLQAPAIKAEKGSLLILKNVYLYNASNQKGKKVLTKTRKAYDVVGIDIYKRKDLMFKILVPVDGSLINGSGFIIETDTELQELGSNKVKVFPAVPSAETDLTNYRSVPSNQLSFTGIHEVSPDFPNLVWRAVNYKTNVPIEFWVAEWAGIYRPDKNSEWLNQTYRKAIEQKLSENLLTKILRGFVEPGFTKEQVRMALGDPLKEQPMEDQTQVEWIYNGRKVVFKNDQVSRVL
ncbi:MAG: hypothetical protein GY866_21795 [Proteobacteria bacterium]|nr:hypothetical protein [Pseudomonadota bacterium]